MMRQAMIYRRIKDGLLGSRAQELKKVYLGRE